MMEYFPKSSFSKPLGDGLLVIVPYNEDTLMDLLNETLDSCVQLIDDFASLCSEDPMINFTTPSKIGIGISRGSACCIMTEDTIVDYSGKVLNLSARLMNVARPKGIVIDASSVRGILKPELEESFATDQIYVRGISESEPVNICYYKDHVIINEIHKKPLNEPEWGMIEDEYSAQQIRASLDNFQWVLPQKPLNPEKIVMRVVRDKYVEGVLHEGFEIISRFHMDDIIVLDEEEIDEPILQYDVDGRKHFLLFDLRIVKEMIEKEGIPDDSIINYEIHYPI